MNLVTDRQPSAFNPAGATPESDPALRLFDGQPKLGAGVNDALPALLAEKWRFDCKYSVPLRIGAQGARAE